MTDSEYVTKLVSDRRRSLGQYLAFSSVRYRLRTVPRVRSVACPCCGFLTITEQGYDTCPLCRWCDDNQDDPHADEVWGGPNGDMSLTAARVSFSKNVERLSTAVEASPEDMLIRSIVTRFDALIQAGSAREFTDGMLAIRSLFDELGTERRRRRIS
jgi:hypothetical protein